jgi:hypothetical protein
MQQEMAKKRRVERITSNNTYEEAFKTHLSAFSNVCAFCHVFNQPEDQSHPLNQCPVLKPDKKKFFEWRTKLRYDKKFHATTKVCYICHVPQGEKDALHPSFTGVKLDCPHPDVIPPIAYAILHHDGLRKEASRAFSLVNWSDDSRVLAWLVGQPVKGHYTNLSALFLWYAQRSVVY